MQYCPVIDCRTNGHTPTYIIRIFCPLVTPPARRLRAGVKTFAGASWLLANFKRLAAQLSNFDDYNLQRRALKDL